MRMDNIHRDTMAPTGMQSEGVMGCCTASTLWGFNTDLDEDYVRRWLGGKKPDLSKTYSEFFSGEEWVARARNRTFFAYLPLHSGYATARKSLEDRGWKCLATYRTDEMHIRNGERYMVGVYFLDAKTNMTAEQIALSEAP